MKLVYWKGAIRNFGDDLNPWLWDRFLPDIFDDDERELFLGVGSVLWDSLPDDAVKIVFGSGYGGYTSSPKVDHTWKVYFVRGPRSADLIGISRSFAIGDPAVLVRAAVADWPAPERNGSIGFIPHWESARDGNWERAAARAGLLFIDPRDDVDSVIGKIRSCDAVVTEAMHGAIVADALRIPWIPYAPLATHHMKWYDWAASMDLTFDFAPSSRSSILELLMLAFCYDKVAIRRFQKYGRWLRTFASFIFVRQAANTLISAARRKPIISTDVQLDIVTRRIMEQIALLRVDYPKAIDREFTAERKTPTTPTLG